VVLDPRPITVPPAAFELLAKLVKPQLVSKIQGLENLCHTNPTQRW
jgi:hypothetical protein